MSTEKRKYIRHPSAIPVVVHRLADTECDRSNMRDVSLGGLAFECAQRFAAGMPVSVEVPSVSAEAELHGFVIWTARHAQRYIVGMAFASEQDAVRSRIVEQACRIEAYRREQQRLRGRILSREEAAAEWIGRFAASFPLQNLHAESPAA